MSVNTRTDWLTQINCDVKCCPPKEFFDGEDKWTTRKTHLDCFDKRQKELARTKISAIKNLKIDSRKFFKKNKQKALSFLISINTYRYYGHQLAPSYDWATVVKHREFRAVYDKIFKRWGEPRAFVRSDYLFNFIDTYATDIMCTYYDDSVLYNGFGATRNVPPSYTLMEILCGFTLQRSMLGQYDYPQLFIYLIARKIKTDKMIQKMGTNFITRLYNPHTELGYNYGLKNIEWAFE